MSSTSVNAPQTTGIKCYGYASESTNKYIWVLSLIKEHFSKPENYSISLDEVGDRNSPRQDHACWILHFERQIKSQS